MLTTEDAARLVRAKAVLDLLTEAVNALRVNAKPALNPGDRASAWVDGVNLGSVQMTDPKPTLHVDDEQALLRWVRRHVPAAIVTRRVTTTTITPAWVERVLKDGGTWTDPKTGEIHDVPGLAVSTATPQLRVEPNDQAKAWAGQMLAAAVTPALTEGHDHD